MNRHPLFYMEINDDQLQELAQLRKDNAKAIEHYTLEMREAQESKNIELCKVISKELLKPEKTFQKALRYVFFILVDGRGQIPLAPPEFLPCFDTIENFLVQKEKNNEV